MGDGSPEVEMTAQHEKSRCTRSRVDRRSAVGEPRSRDRLADASPGGTTARRTTAIVWHTDKLSRMVKFADVADGRTTSVFQDAVRLLLLIAAAADPLASPSPADAPAEAVAVLRSQVLLQKLDFWLRNPDYLADELLTRFESTGNNDDLELARQILESDEPEVRSYQMLRYLFGAYEPLDEALSVLSTPGLIILRRQGIPGHTTQHDYYLTNAGRDAAQQIVTSVPELAYYVERSKLVADLAGGRRGSALRDIQYLQPEYAGAELGTRIVGIADRARARLQGLLNTQKQRETR
ncbi:hypothetical protein DFO66_107139 [Brevibacterium sanguinis]|uniref:Uncharacterized protein n=3 Tax=Brevibacteriaceae TaxID=85019 RepID=A0A366IHZ5_9MICO|nr:hypothetical protein DFO66_107139 [Brevibacterium sanguinis]RBP71446.1 hypothetical protein DFO65_10545 [Brevibacterium celere]